jgi:tetratricopeptide (TPR) repeat protein
MSEKNAGEFFLEGMNALNEGRTHIALHCFEEAAKQEESPEIISYLAFCLAKERQDYRLAVSFCRWSIAEDPGNSAHYLNLGRILLLDGRKQDAIRVFRDGLLHENNPSIMDELKNLGTRKYPVISSLPRDHRVNRVLGKLFTRLKLR